MQAHTLRRDAFERHVHRAHDEPHEVEKIAERLVREQRMTLHCEIRGIDLKNESGIDDGPVFVGECGCERANIGFRVGIVLVAHGGRDDAGRGRSHERVSVSAFLCREQARQPRAIRGDGRSSAVGDLTDGRRRCE